jgi:hypothetical protein
MEQHVSKSDEALKLLASKLGRFDNIKLLLGNSADMTMESFGDEFHIIATAIANGELDSDSTTSESLLDDVRIVFN